jgi:hypothetical protein
VITSVGVTMLSIAPSRRQAAMAPVRVPRMKARMVVRPNRPSVQKMPLDTTLLTDSG